MKRHVLYINSIAELVHNDHGHITGFAFDTMLVRMDEKLYNYFVRHAGDKPYEFNLLRVNDQMAKVRDCTATELIARVQGEE
jgi:hypothetical protein